VVLWGSEYACTVLHSSDIRSVECRTWFVCETAALCAVCVRWNMSTTAGQKIDAAVIAAPYREEVGAYAAA
jgi:hypothetical protein